MAGLRWISLQVWSPGAYRILYYGLLPGCRPGSVNYVAAGPWWYYPRVY